MEETQAFVDLARQKIETKQKRRERYSDAKWNLLRVQLIQDNYSPQAPTTRDFAKTQIFAPDPPDTSHILGRETWLQSMLDHLHSQPAKKLIVVQGPPGIGKSSTFTLLLRNLADDDRYLPLYFHDTVSNIGVLAEEYLDRLLATIIATLAVYTEDTQTLPLSQRIDFAIHQLATASKHVVLLLDHAEVLLQERGVLLHAGKSSLRCFFIGSIMARFSLQHGNGLDGQGRIGASFSNRSCLPSPLKVQLSSGGASALAMPPNTCCWKRVADVEATRK